MSNINIPAEVQSEKTDRHYVWLILICILSVLLRLVRLGTFDFWHDETYNLIISDNLYNFLFHGYLACNHPPLAYILLAAWRQIGFDGNEWLIRLLPMLFGVLGVGALYLLGRTLFDKRTGLLAAFLLAISPFHVLHSQESKEYIYLPFFATLMVLFFFRATTDNRRWDWFFYGFLAGICCYTEAFAAPLLVAINCWFLLLLICHRERSLVLNWIGANLFGAIIFLPWLGMMLSKAHAFMVEAKDWWVPVPSLLRVAFYFKTIAFGYGAIKPFFHVAFLLFLALFIYGSYRALRTNTRTALLLLFWAVFPVVLVYGISFVGQSIFLIRAMLPYAMPVYLLVAVAITNCNVKKCRYISLTAVTILCCIGLGAHYLRCMHPLQQPHRPGVHPPSNFSDAARYVLDNFSENDVVIHSSPATWLPFYWYGFKSSEKHFIGAHNAAFIDFMLHSYVSPPHVKAYMGKLFEGLHSFEPFNANLPPDFEDIYFTEDIDDPELLRHWPRMMEVLVRGHNRIILVFSEWEREYLKGQSAFVYRWLDSRYQEVGRSFFKGIEVITFLTPDHPDAQPTLKRDRDSGVSAELYYQTWEYPYTKVLPDWDLVSKTPDQRKGRLLLRFSDALPPEKLPGAQESCDSSVCFTISNESDEPSTFKIYTLSSEVLLPCAAFTRSELTFNEWHYGQQYDPYPPHHGFDLWALGGAFTRQSASAYYTLSLPAGIYRPMLFALLPINDAAMVRGKVTVRDRNQNASMFPDIVSVDKAAWGWIAGLPFEHPESNPLDIVITGEPAEKGITSYIDLGYLAFINTDHEFSTPSIGELLEPWKRDVVLQAHTSEYYSVPVHPETRRQDIWVYEDSDSGKAYHIFQIRN